MALPPDNLRRLRISVEGRVQGVGFRPAVYRLASRLALTGFVRNTSGGVMIEAQGPHKAVGDFVAQLQGASPRQAVIESLAREEIKTLAAENTFAIVASRRSGDLRAGMPPDLALCDLCRQELFDSNNRRCRYPFINCTDCGPRFSIIRGLPYDRERTTMEKFRMCPDCGAEFKDPLNRRFEAQPNACPVCGPKIRLINEKFKAIGGDPIASAAKMLKAGKILAVKGIGGYHLCCDALNADAVRLLRERKQRPAKSLAVMFKSLQQVREYCELSSGEAEALTDVAAPIVVVRTKPNTSLAWNLSPDTRDIGAFLPYAPLHCLLLADGGPLVMTSGNRCDEPIAINEEELKNILGTIADAALVHDRPIARRCDDSVKKMSSAGQIMLRRSRGYVPQSIRLPVSGPPVLACGAELKNTVCLTRGDRAFMSAHIGDLDDVRNYNFFQETARDFRDLLEIKPEIIAYDPHPDYVATRYALECGGAKLCPVQHHHAHIAACLAEHRIMEQVIGIALDGAGFGADGNIWGGELFIADLRSCQRVGHFKEYPLPGGQQAIRDPARMALSCLLLEFGGEAEPLIVRLLPSISGREKSLLLDMVARCLHSPLTSSAGRLFDAVAALLGLGDQVSYEGRAAIRLQTLADKTISRDYPHEILEQDGMLVLSFAPTLRALVADLESKADVSHIAGMFHNTVAAALAGACRAIRERSGLNRVALSGGVFQNDLLLEKTINCLKEEKFAVYINSLVPPNDGGIALGQAAVAVARNNF